MEELYIVFKGRDKDNEMVTDHFRVSKVLGVLAIDR